MRQEGIDVHQHYVSYYARAGEVFLTEGGAIHPWKVAKLNRWDIAWDMDGTRRFDLLWVRIIPTDLGHERGNAAVAFG